jgi:hypothetical protein
MAEMRAAIEQGDFAGFRQRFAGHGQASRYNSRLSFRPSWRFMVLISNAYAQAAGAAADPTGGLMGMLPIF